MHLFLQLWICKTEKSHGAFSFLVQNLFISHTIWPKRDQLFWASASSPVTSNLTSQTIFTLFWVMLHLRCLADEGSPALHGKRTLVGKELSLHLVVRYLWFFSLKTFPWCFTKSRVCDKSIISDTILNVGLFFGLMLMVICNLLILMQYLCSWKLISSFNNSFSDKI